jgi:hypothetical protein
MKYRLLITKYKLSIINYPLLIICAALLLCQCSEPYSTSIELEQFMYLSLSGAKENPNIRKVDPDRDATFSLSVLYGGTTNYEQGDISAEIGVDNSLIEAYNTANNANCLPLPANAFSFDKNTLLIENGKKVSDRASITVKATQLDLADDYILPITIRSASGGKLPVNEELKTVYFVIQGNVDAMPDEDKWTVHGASSVWQPGYEVENVYDGNRNTYWHSDLSGMPQWIAINMNGFKRVEGITWVNRQDQGQDALPKHVKIETSMDGEVWTEALDIPELPNVRVMQVIEFPKPAIARFFKVNVLSSWNNAPYTYLAEVGIYSGDKPLGDYDWEKKTWKVTSFSSQWDDSGYAARNVIDDDQNSAWHSEPFDATKNGMPQWIVIDMQKRRPAIKGLKIWNRQNDHGGEPKHIIFSVSDDQENWTDILDLPEMSNDYLEELDYKTTQSAQGRYLKVYVESNWSNFGWTYISEITPY